MAALVIANITPQNRIGVERSLTQEFLQYRKNVVRNYHSLSDTEEIRWVWLLILSAP